MSLMPRVEEFEAYIRAGFQLIPLHKYDYIDDKGRERGKSPLHRYWQKKDYDHGHVLKMAQAGYNVGVRLTADVMVLDVDPRNFPEGRNSLEEMVKDLGLDLSTCPHTVTGSGGDHFWFRKPVDVSILDSLPDYPGIEFKSKGRQVVAAGSVHPSKEYYKWDDFAPPMTELPQIPHTLLSMIRRAEKATGSEAAGYGEMSPERLEETLSLLDPEEFQDEGAWRELMMACHHATGGEGRSEFIEWSTSDPKYADHGREIGYRWDSLDKVKQGGRPITIRYLFKVVQDKGFEVPPVPPEEDFDEWEEVEDGDGVDDEKLRAEPEPDLMDLMNEKHCVVLDNGKFRIYTRQHDPVLNRAFYAKSMKTDFLDMYGNRAIETPNGATTVGRWWIGHGQRRQYQGVIFDPSRNHEGWLNLWEGWAFIPRKGDWSLMKELILTVLCNGNAAHYEYVLNWMAYMVQFPDRPAEVALCFKGEKGTGKGTLGRALANLAGPHGLHISSPEHLTGRFNSHLQNVICLFADEAFWAGDKTGESKLKTLVTEPTIAIEGKGVDVITAKNLIHIVMASNNDWVVPAGLDGERRFAVFEVNNKRRGDHAFFKALNHQLQNGGYAGMLFDLLCRDLGDWAPRSDVPQTSALMAQKIDSLDPEQRWWFSVLSEGNLPNQRSPWYDPERGECIVLKPYLMTHWKAWCKEHGYSRSVMGKLDPEMRMGRFLNKMVPLLKNRQVPLLDSDFGFTVGKSGLVNAWAFPSLDHAREAFERMVGAEKGELWV